MAWYAQVGDRPLIMQSTVSFPRSRRESLRETGSWISGRERRISTTNRDVALEVHDLVYGTPSPTTAPLNNDIVLANLERLYEPNAGEYNFPFCSEVPVSHLFNIQGLVIPHTLAFVYLCNVTSAVASYNMRLMHHS
jgi:hypothetical protein